MDGKQNKINKASKPIKRLAIPVAVIALVFNGIGAHALEVGESSLMDSLIPPEVVPYEGSNLGVKQQLIKESEQVPSSLNMNLSPVTSGYPMNGTAQEIRQAAFKQMMGNGNLATLINQANQMNAANQAMSQAPSTSGGAPQFNQPNWLNQGPDSYSSLGGVTQSQTLSAGSKLPMERRDTRRGGSANKVSGLGALGSGLFLGSTLRRPNSLFGLGVAGLSATGFGTRNGLRY